MSLSLKIFYTHRSLVCKLTCAFLFVVFLPMLLVASISYSVIDSILLDKAKVRLNIGLKAALSEYYARGEQMRYGMLQAATSSAVREGILEKDVEYLR